MDKNFETTRAPVQRLVMVLQSNGIPIKAVKEDSSEDDKRDMALATHDEVVVTDWKTASGLERRIVICLNSYYNENY
jgi:hypothetical protein